MTSTQHSELAARLELPRPDRDISSALSSMIVVSFAAVACFNLANYHVLPVYAIVLSVIWLLIVAVGLSFSISDVYEHGFRQFAVDRLAPFSPHHFIEAQRQIDDHSARFGFILFKRQFVQLRISISDVASVACRSGQATSLAGRDMDDWHVFVWYRHKGAKRWSETGHREEAS